MSSDGLFERLFGLVFYAILVVWIGVLVGALSMCASGDPCSHCLLGNEPGICFELCRGRLGR